MSQQKLERSESDSIGTKSVPRDAYYGVQSLRAFENFHITGQTTHPTMIRSLAYIKKACALANGRAGALPKPSRPPATASWQENIWTSSSRIPSREAPAPLST